MPGPHPTHVSIPSFKMATGKKDRLQMIYEKDGRNTSSSDPEMMESRIFIGNLIKKVQNRSYTEISHHHRSLVNKWKKNLPNMVKYWACHCTRAMASYNLKQRSPPKMPSTLKTETA